MKKLTVLAAIIAMLFVTSFPSHAAEMGETNLDFFIVGSDDIAPAPGGRAERIAYLGFRRHEFGIEKPLWQFIEFMIAEDARWAEDNWIFSLMAEAYPDEDLYPESEDDSSSYPTGWVEPPEEIEAPNYPTGWIEPPAEVDAPVSEEGEAESDATESAAEETLANEQEETAVTTEPEAESKQEEVSTATEPEPETEQVGSTETKPENNTQTAAETNRSVMLSPIVINNDQASESIHYIDHIGGFSQIAQYRQTLIRETSCTIKELHTRLKAIVK